MDVGVDIPQFVLADTGPLVARYAARAEELGFAGLWAMDDVLSARPFLDGLEVLTYAAAVTREVTLGIAVLIVSRHNPAVLAKRLTTLDQLSGGRLVVGLGVGHDDESVAGLGIPTTGLGARLEEAIAVLREFWTKPRASFQGATWSFSDLPMEPKPLKHPHPPVWLGGGSPSAIRRAARVADGWIGAGSSSTAQFRQHVLLLAEALEADGRDRDRFPIAKRVYISVDEDSDRARRRLGEYVDSAYGREGLGERVGVYGPVERCAEQLREVVAAGATELVLSLVADPLGQLEAAAAAASVT